MELSVLANLYGNLSLDRTLAKLSALGVKCVEIGAGGYPGKAHCDGADFLAHPEKIENLKKVLAENNMELSALACHGNPLHPDKEIAERFEKDFDAAVLLAEQLGVKTVVAFSGCPGDCPVISYSNLSPCSLPVSKYCWVLPAARSISSPSSPPSSLLQEARVNTAVKARVRHKSKAKNFFILIPPLGGNAASYV